MPKISMVTPLLLPHTYIPRQEKKSPNKKIFFLPKISANRPKVTSVAQFIIPNTIIIHCIYIKGVFVSLCIVGSAVLTMVNTRPIDIQPRHIPDILNFFFNPFIVSTFLTLLYQYLYCLFNMRDSHKLDLFSYYAIEPFEILL